MLCQVFLETLLMCFWGDLQHHIYCLVSVCLFANAYAACFLCFQVYLSFNNVSALKMLAARKNWRLTSEKDKVSAVLSWDGSFFLCVYVLVLFFIFPHERAGCFTWFSVPRFVFTRWSRSPRWVSGWNRRWMFLLTEPLVCWLSWATGRAGTHIISNAHTHTYYGKPCKHIFFKTY